MTNNGLATPGVSSRRPPSVSRLRSIGELPRLMDNAADVLMRHSLTFRGAFYYYFGGIKRVLVVSDALILKRIFKDNAGNYIKSDIQVERLGQFAGAGLVTDQGAEWLQKRRLMQRAFRPDRLSDMVPSMHATLDEVLLELEQRARNGPVNLASEMTAIVLASLMKSLFSVRLPPEQSVVISDGINTLQDFVVRQILHPYLERWFEISGELSRHHEIRAGVDRFLEKIVEQHRAEPQPQDDFLQLLIDAGPNDLGYAFTPQQILNESVHMLVAGHETSANALTWLLHLLSLNPDYADCIRNELRGVLGDTPLGARDLADLPLTAAAIEEAMRLFPPFWMIDRTAVRDDEAGGFVIPAGTTIVAFIYGAHHDPRRWNEPERFMPARFGGKANNTRSGFDYMPFGAGPRSCLGFQYSMIQMTVILSTIIRRFRFSAVEPTPMKPRALISLRPKDDIRMHFEPLAQRGIE